MATGEGTIAAPDLHWDPIPLNAIEDARQRLHGVALRTPLVRLDADDIGAEVFLKLECLQPVRSFKVRGAYNAMAKAGRAVLRDGVWTVSSGNMAQAAALTGRAGTGRIACIVSGGNVDTKTLLILLNGGTPA